MICNLRITTNT